MIRVLVRYRVQGERRRVRMLLSRIEVQGLGGRRVRIAPWGAR